MEAHEQQGQAITGPRVPRLAGLTLVLMPAPWKVRLLPACRSHKTPKKGPVRSRELRGSSALHQSKHRL